MNTREIAFNELILAFPVPDLHGMAEKELKLARCCALNGDRKAHYIFASKLLAYLAEVEMDMGDYPVV